MRMSSNSISGSGIYKITLLYNGRLYVGSAVDLKRRSASHKVSLRNGKHLEKELYGLIPLTALLTWRYTSHLVSWRQEAYQK